MFFRSVFQFLCFVFSTLNSAAKSFFYLSRLPFLLFCCISQFSFPPSFKSSTFRSTFPLLCFVSSLRQPSTFSTFLVSLFYFSVTPQSSLFSPYLLCLLCSISFLLSAPAPLLMKPCILPPSARLFSFLLSVVARMAVPASCPPSPYPSPSRSTSFFPPAS